MPLMFGRLPAQHTGGQLRRALVLSRHLDPLGKPPAVSNNYIKAVHDLTGGDWGMMGNDRYGDCVKADDAHYLMLRTANTGKMVVPTTEQVVTDYMKQTGGQDTGLYEDQDDDWMEQNGMLGHKSVAHGSIDPSNMDHVRWGVQLFGRVRLGIAVTQEMVNQFDRGQPWTATDMRHIVGLHDVPLVYYDQDDHAPLVVITWGKEQRMSLHCFRACCASLARQHEGETHVELFPDWIKEIGTAPSGLNLEQLTADLAHVSDAGPG